ncbi:hypothetical protein GCM10022406_13480 [Hymenobacter algoricola]|uniref:Uncharacterized protein n=2 Tax=Hymenobacter algoricola TaxID=486267 RepID=A0ABP7MUX3_9BACT
MLAPEAWVLVLHAHEHTQEEAAQAPAAARKDKPLLTPQHQHCHVDQFYHVPLLPAAPVLVPVPVSRVGFTVRAILPVPGLPSVDQCERAARGPPQA